MWKLSTLLSGNKHLDVGIPVVSAATVKITLGVQQNGSANKVIDPGDLSSILATHMVER